MFILPLYLTCDECSSITIFKGTVNLLYWIVQIHSIAKSRKCWSYSPIIFSPPLSEDVSLLPSFLIFCNFRWNPNTSTRVTAWFPCYPTRKYALPCLCNTLVFSCVRSLCGLSSLTFPSLPGSFQRNFKSSHKEFILVSTSGNPLKSLFCLEKPCNVVSLQKEKGGCLLEWQPGKCCHPGECCKLSFKGFCGVTGTPTFWLNTGIATAWHSHSW